MNLTLKDFIDMYGVLYEKDIDIILAWSTYNQNQAELIAAIADMASLMQTKFLQDKRKHWEWTYYAFCNLIEDLEPDADATKCINTLRMAYMAYENNPKSFAKIAEKIMLCKNISWEAINDMHPEIKTLYERGLKEE